MPAIEPTVERARRLANAAPDFPSAKQCLNENDELMPRERTALIAEQRDKHTAGRCLRIFNNGRRCTRPAGHTGNCAR